jgi:hypothetical protein
MQQERFVDYMFYPYQPRAPIEGKWRSSDLLTRALEITGADPRQLDLLHALRRRFGKDRTIWALKKKGAELALELYFYNYGREDPEVTPSHVLQAISPWLRSSEALARRCDGLRYFLFSIDADAGRLRAGAVEGLHVYVHDVADRATGFSYFVDERGGVLENHYAFYRPRQERPDLEIKIRDTVHVDFRRVPIERVLLPELIDCKTVCSARKARSDSVYFSGLGVDQFRHFLARFDYPTALRAWVQGERDRLDHLEFDVAMDYTATGDALEVAKTSFDGSF